MIFFFNVVYFSNTKHTPAPSSAENLIHVVSGSTAAAAKAPSFEDLLGLMTDAFSAAKPFRFGALPFGEGGWGLGWSAWIVNLIRLVVHFCFHRAISEEHVPVIF
jgi:hypothetical protein